MSSRRFGEWFLTSVPLIAFLALWQIVGSSSQRMGFLYSTPTTIMTTLFTQLQQGQFWNDIGITSAEVVGGLVLGNSMGTALALLLWLFPTIGRISQPYVVAIGSIPVFAIMPLFILWFGIGFSGKLAIIIFSTAFVALAYSFAAAVAVGREYEEMIASIGGSRADLLRKIVVPGIISRSFIAYRINVSFALIGAYVAEWVSAKSGLGQFILRATSLYDVPRVWTGLIMFLALAFILYGLTSLAERLAVPGSKTRTSRPLW
ncbi:MAG: ABC transporter permease [Candidatus Angelobacter sp.]